MQLHLTRAEVVVPVTADPRGVTGPTPGRARGPRWRTTSPGRFVPSGVEQTTEQRIVEAVAGAPDGSAATGWAALHWQGARWFGGWAADGTPLPVPVSLGDAASRVRRAGVQYCHDWLFDDDVVEVDGLPITRPARSVSWAARRAQGLEEAVQVVDMALASDLVDLAALTRYAERLGPRQHTRRLRSALALADENAWSPMEVTMRLRWLARTGRRPLCNAPVFDLDGNHLLTPDLLDPEAGVAGEYDGVVHDEVRVRRRDLDREELCRELGLETVSMISTDLRDGHSFERRLDAAYRRASARASARGAARGAARAPGGRRTRWTLARPDGWPDTSTVAARRALTPEQRARWLTR